MISILTLLALYVLYSECIKLPAIIKKNKKLCYVLVVGLYFYYHQTNVVEGAKTTKTYSSLLAGVEDRDFGSIAGSLLLVFFIYILIQVARADDGK
tara:strand:+ start:259 stop:546 length:288 start_codon:yes stop_codon:yes gene_type:complete